MKQYSTCGMRVWEIYTSFCCCCLLLVQFFFFLLCVVIMPSTGLIIATIHNIWCVVSNWPNRILLHPRKVKKKPDEKEVCTKSDDRSIFKFDIDMIVKHIRHTIWSTQFFLLYINYCKISMCHHRGFFIRFFFLCSFFRKCCHIETVYVSFDWQFNYMNIFELINQY